MNVMPTLLVVYSYIGGALQLVMTILVILCAIKYLKTGKK